MKVLSSQILLQEVPDEISLGLSITNCPYNCKYCHTPQLREDIGTHWIPVVNEMVPRYRNGITCVLFLGGDNQWDELTCAAEYVREEFGLKTAVYLGSILFPDKLLDVFDYIKVGPYIHELGGLDSPTTNQRFYKVENKELIDITSKFWRKNNENQTK